MSAHPEDLRKAAIVAARDLLERLEAGTARCIADHACAAADLAEQWGNAQIDYDNLAALDDEEGPDEYEPSLSACALNGGGL